MNGNLIRICRVCGRVFVSPYRRGMYCGSVCKDRAFHGRLFLDKDCPICGTKFKTCDRKRKFCSDACRDEARRRRRGVKDAVCVVCGKPLPRRKGSHKTCSPECYRENEKRTKNAWARLKWQEQKAIRATLPHAMHDKVCPFCGKDFVTEKKIQKYCSAACRLAAKAEMKKGKKTVPATCRECGKEFLAWYPSQRFCSRHCAMVWRHGMGLNFGREPEPVQQSWGYDADDDMIYGNMIAI